MNKKVEDIRHRCEACDYQKLKRLEHNTVILELRDKIEQLNFRLAETKNENHALKRNLQLAKKVVFKETGACSGDFQDILKHGVDPNRKERIENIHQLRRKVQELQDHLNKLEGYPILPNTAASQEYAERITAGDNAVWKKELEQRLSKKAVEKIMNPLLEECTDLRKKLDTEKKRFKELIGEVNLFRAEVQSQINKNKEDMSITSSFQTLESQLQEMLTERAKIRNDLAGSKACNARLEEEIITLRDALQSASNKAKENNLLIDSFAKKHKHIQEAIENEKSIVQQKMDLYRLELQKFKDSYEEGVIILDSLQNVFYERHELLKNMEEFANSGFTVYLDQQKDDFDSSTPRYETESHTSSPTDEETVNENSKNEETVQNGSQLQIEIIQEETVPISKEQLQILIDFAKYKALFDAANIEKDRLLYMIQTQESQLNEMALQVVETGRFIVQKDSEKKSLLERISQLQKKLAMEKDKNICSQTKNCIGELKNKVDSLREENEFIKNYVQSVLDNASSDLSLHKKFMQESRQFFLEGIQDFMKNFEEKKQHFIPNTSEISDNQESIDE